MQFIIPKPKENILNLMRRLSYSPQEEDSKTGERQFSRFLGPSGYPRFHLYIKETENKLILNLHLDQKKPSYPGAAAHNAEYEGNTIEKEAERIKQGLMQILK